MSDGWISGSFSVSVDMSANAAAGINIVASAFSNQMDVVKAGINNCLTKDGQNTATANLPLGGFRHLSAGAPTATDQYTRVHEYVHMSPIYMVDANSGSSLSISVSSTPFPASLSAGMRLWIRNTTRPKPSASANPLTLHVAGMSANVSAEDGGPLWPGAVSSAGTHEFIYDGTSFKLKNPKWIRVSMSYAVQARTAAGAVTTVTPAATVSVSVDCLRNNDFAYVRFMDRISAQPLTFSTSTGKTVFVSALPAYVRPTKRQAQTVHIRTSTNVDRIAVAVVSTNGVLKITPDGHNLDTACDVFPFIMVYPLK